MTCTAGHSRSCPDLLFRHLNVKGMCSVCGQIDAATSRCHLALDMALSMLLAVHVLAHVPPVLQLLSCDIEEATAVCCRQRYEVLSFMGGHLMRTMAPTSRLGQNPSWMRHRPHSTLLSDILTSSLTCTLGLDCHTPQ